MSGLLTQARPIKGGQVRIRSDTLSPESILTEHTMATNDRPMSKSHQPQYAQTERTTRAVAAFVSVVVSSTLLGGMLGMFEMQSEGAAIARASIKVQPSNTGIALQRVGPASRG